MEEKICAEMAAATVQSGEGDDPSKEALVERRLNEVRPVQEMGGGEESLIAHLLQLRRPSPAVTSALLPAPLIDEALLALRKFMLIPHLRHHRCYHSLLLLMQAVNTFNQVAMYQAVRIYASVGSGHAAHRLQPAGRIPAGAKACPPLARVPAGPRCVEVSPAGSLRPDTTSIERPFARETRLRNTPWVSPTFEREQCNDSHPSEHRLGSPGNIERPAARPVRLPEDPRQRRAVRLAGRGLGQLPLRHARVASGVREPDVLQRCLGPTAKQLPAAAWPHEAISAAWPPAATAAATAERAERLRVADRHLPRGCIRALRARQPLEPVELLARPLNRKQRATRLVAGRGGGVPFRCDYVLRSAERRQGLEDRHQPPTRLTDSPSDSSGRY